jgi:Spy/CpxP family protein refolding chaperone
MKKTLLIALLLVLTAGMAIAQQQGGPDSFQGGKGKQGNFQRGNPVERLTENLGLDESQAAQIALIFEDAQLLRNEERERSWVVSEEIHTNTHAQVLEVLTPEQQALFEEQRQKREEFRQALEDARAERGFVGGRGSRDCDN